MPTRPSRSSADSLTDARNVLDAAKKHWSAFKALNADRKKKLLDPALLTRLAENIEAARLASGGTAAGKVAARAATSNEVEARKNLLTALVAIRDDIRLAYPDDKAVGRAFGVGAKLSDKITKRLVDAATAIVATAKDKTSNHGALAKDAGVTTARLNALDKLRQALEAADQAQGQAMDRRKSSASKTTTGLGAIRKDVTQIRAAAKVVFKANKEALAEFASKVARHAPTKRAVKAKATEAK